MRRWIETWAAFPKASVDGAVALEAVQVAERFQTSHFEAPIRAAAKSMGCGTVYSEDLSEGKVRLPRVSTNPGQAHIS